MEKLLLTAQDVMDMLSISKSTLERRIRAGDIHPVMLGPQTRRFKVSEVYKLAGAEPPNVSPERNFTILEGSAAL
ncbi:MAG: helix-turn-helix domain-containing protein [Firmicutes bacterium]|nr:helix-turn-helix domain-containing protein [Bacillota bacterium]MBQ6901132.1 helix-turn-helix domain-containing protein [Bacillota bacterium]